MDRPARCEARRRRASFIRFRTGLHPCWLHLKQRSSSWAARPQRQSRQDAGGSSNTWCRMETSFASASTNIWTLGGTMADLKLKAADGCRLRRLHNRGRLRVTRVVIQSFLGSTITSSRSATTTPRKGIWPLHPPCLTGSTRVLKPATQGRRHARPGAKGQSDNDAALADISAAADAVRSAGRVAVVGYCWGGALAWLTATRVDGIAAASSYYGGGIGGFAGEQPKCPVILHFGEQDHAIPMDEVQKVKDTQSFGALYPAGHGFNCDHRGSFQATSARSPVTDFGVFRRQSWVGGRTAWRRRLARSRGVGILGPWPRNRPTCYRFWTAVVARGYRGWARRSRGLSGLPVGRV